MSVEEIRRPAIGPISESANLSIHRAWPALGEAASDKSCGEGRDEAVAAAAAALLEHEPALPPDTRRVLASLLHSHHCLEGEVARLRTLLQEWILSQLTYKALYYQYSGQSVDAPSEDRMREKERMRRTIREQLHSGGDHCAVLGRQSRSSNRP
jgi:hypothetical protein